MQRLNKDRVYCGSPIRYTKVEAISKARCLTCNVLCVFKCCLKSWLVSQIHLEVSQPPSFTLELFGGCILILSSLFLGAINLLLWGIVISMNFLSSPRSGLPLSRSIAKHCLCNKCICPYRLWRDPSPTQGTICRLTGPSGLLTPSSIPRYLRNGFFHYARSLRYR